MGKVKEMRKSLERNKYYLFSMSLVFTFLYSCLVLTNSESIYTILDNMQVLRSSLIFIIISIYIISIKFTIEGTKLSIMQNSKQFGIYTLAGISPSRYARINIIEMIPIFLVSLTYGIIFGITYSFFILLLLREIFDITSIYVNIFDYTLIIEFILSFIILLFINYFAIFLYLRKTDIKDLIYPNLVEKSEIRYKNRNLYNNLIVIVFTFIGLIFYGGKILKEQSNMAIVYIAISMFFLALFIHRITLITNVVKYIYKIDEKNNHNKNYVYLYLKEVKRSWGKYSKSQGFNTTVIVMFSILFYLSLVTGFSYKENIPREAPFGLIVSIDSAKVNYDIIVDYIAKNSTVLNDARYNIYKYDIKQNDTMSSDQFMMLSDYNVLREMLGKQPIYIEKNEFIVQVEERETRNEFTNENICINGKSYNLSKEGVQCFPFSQYDVNGKNKLIVLNNQSFDKNIFTPFRSIYVCNFSQTPNSNLKNEIYRLINISKNIVQEEVKEGITVKVVLQEWSRLNGLVGLVIISVLGMYISIISLILSISSIALYSIQDISKLKYESLIYLNLGWNEKTVHKYNMFRLNKFYESTTILFLTFLSIIVIIVYVTLSEHFNNKASIFLFALIVMITYFILIKGYIRSCDVIKMED